MLLHTHARARAHTHTLCVCVCVRVCVCVCVCVLAAQVGLIVPWPLPASVPFTCPLTSTAKDFNPLGRADGCENHYVRQQRSDGYIEVPREGGEEGRRGRLGEAEGIKVLKVMEDCED
jgi:hypothetical protein